MVRCLCSLPLVAAIVASLALTAMADIPPPPPERGLKRVPLEHVVKLEKDIPGYKFYTCSGSVGGGEKLQEELKLGTERAIKVPSSSSPSFWTGVVAVPDKVREELKTNENIAKLLSWENREKLPAGVVLHDTHGNSRDLKENDPRSKVENVITISADDKAGVKFTAAEIPAPAGAAGESSSQPPSAMMYAGIALSVAVVTAGLWWFRRK